MQIGNAVINDETDVRGMYEYFQSHALISDEAAYQIQKYCDFSPNATRSDECNAATEEAEENISHLDIYNIYAPLCSNSSLTARPKKASVSRQAVFLICIRVKIPFIGQAVSLTVSYENVQITNFDPCSDYYVYAYLNRPDVQQALHANVTKLDHDWEPCSDILRNWQDSPSTIIPLLREFMENGLRLWIFR